MVEVVIALAAISIMLLVAFAHEATRNYRLQRKMTELREDNRQLQKEIDNTPTWHEVAKDFQLQPEIERQLLDRLYEDYKPIFTHEVMNHLYPIMKRSLKSKELFRIEAMVAESDRTTECYKFRFTVGQFNAEYEVLCR